MSKTQSERLRTGLIVVLLVGLASCGGDDDSSFTIGGTVSGLATGLSVTLTDNGRDTLTLSANGPFTFKTPLADGSSYAAVISAAPAQQTCTLTSGTGAVSGSAVKSVTVHCVGPYTVGGTVSGLVAGSNIILTDNGADSDTVIANGTFVFATALKGGSAYTVSITSQPAQQACTVADGSGSIATASVTSISISCIGPFSVGGQVSGLSAGASVTITDNGADSLTVAANGSFGFHTALKPGSSFAVAISQLPAGEQCGLAGSTGILRSTSYTGITVTCAIPTLQLLAGALGGSGSVDGDRNTARFYNPTDVVADGTGNLFVADDYNALVRRIDVLGNVTTVAGKPRQTGTTDGAGAAARFNNPSSLAMDPSGNVYVVDGGANTIRKISPSGQVSTLAGTPLVNGTADGTGAAAQFTSPGNIRWAGDGSLYLTDSPGIRNITPAGVVTTVYLAYGLSGLDVSQPGIVYATDYAVKSAFEIDLSADTQTTIAVGFENPSGIVMASPTSGAAGTVYVADQFTSVLDEISPTGVLSTLAGSLNHYGYANGTGPSAQFYAPVFMSLNAMGNIVLADSGANSIRQITPAGVVTTIAGTAPQTGNVNGAGLVARFNNPETLVTDLAGNLFVGDYNGIREITASGQVTTPFSQSVNGLATDGKGDFYFTTFAYNSIQRIAPDGTTSLLAGSQYVGFADGTGAAAGFDQPRGLAVDSQGNVLVADSGNARIRKITPAGVVTTLAGSTKGSADGTGTAASFLSLFAMAIDSQGTLYVTDGNAIRKVTSSGVVTTLAGSQAYGSSDGLGAAAQFDSPGAVAIGPNGAIFVSDSGNNTIREISAAGVVTTLVGSAHEAGVKLGPLPTTINVPVGLAYIGTSLYIVDAGENSILALRGVFD